jgi:predicted esterase
MLHGVCVPPSYVCGGWAATASDVGILVCPTGNTTCGADGAGGPTWEEPFADMDRDLEQAIASTVRRVSPKVTRTGAVLAGFSRGAYVAVILAVRHPGRWPFLILNEADVELTVPMLHAANVRAVALIAGEWSAQVAGERKTAEALAHEGYPARLWVMPKVGHAYSPDIDTIMNEAVHYVLAYESRPVAEGADAGR